MVSIWLTPVNGMTEIETYQKSASQDEADFQKNSTRLKGVLLAVLLDAGGAKAR
jgi:hypothetical protein